MTIKTTKSKFIKALDEIDEAIELDAQLLAKSESMLTLTSMENDNSLSALERLCANRAIEIQTNELEEFRII